MKRVIYPIVILLCIFPLFHKDKLLGRIKEVGIYDYYFSPNVVLASRWRDTVRWTNFGNLAHSTKSRYWSSGVLSPNSSYRWWATDTGYIQYYDSIYPNMRGEVICFPGLIRDLEVVAIFSPKGIIPESTTITPTVRIRNNGDTIETNVIEFSILKDDTIYEDSILVSIGPGKDTLVSFASFFVVDTGLYEVECEIIVDDWYQENDEATDSFQVVKRAREWRSLPEVPEGPSGKPPGRGGSMTMVSASGKDALHLLFLFKGNNTDEFLAFNCNTQMWEIKKPIPPGASRKKVKSGASLCWNRGDTIYALKGSNTLEFWAYSISGDDWVVKKDVPAGTKKVKVGSGLCYVKKGDSSLVFCFKGSNTQEFYAYYREGDAWLPKANTPTVMKAGSCIVYDSVGKVIYALQGSKDNLLFAYSILTNTWSTKKPMPLIGRAGRKKKVKDGACMTFDDTLYIHALKAGRTQEYWKYNTVEDTWIQGPDVPLPPSNKPVGPGAGIAFRPFGSKDGVEGEVYIVKGNKTDDAYTMTVEAEEKFTLISEEKEKEIYPAILEKSLFFRTGQPEPSGYSIEIYNVYGKLIEIIKDNRTEKLSKIPFGVYFFKIKSPFGVRAGKMVIIPK